jgi:ribosomal protein L31E
MPHHPWEVNAHIWKRHKNLISDNIRIRIAIPCREGKEEEKK